MLEVLRTRARVLLAAFRRGTHELYTETPKPTRRYRRKCFVTPGGALFWLEVHVLATDTAKTPTFTAAFNISRLSRAACLGILSQLLFISWWFATDHCELIAEPTAGALTQLLVRFPLILLGLPIVALLLSQIDGFRRLPVYTSGYPRKDLLVRLSARVLRWAIFFWIGFLSVNPLRFFLRWDALNTLWKAARGPFVNDTILRAGDWSIRRKADIREIHKFIGMHTYNWAKNRPEQLPQITKYLLTVKNELVTAYRKGLSPGLDKLHEVLAKFRAESARPKPLIDWPSLSKKCLLVLSRTLSLGHAYVVEHPGQVVGIILAFAIGGFLFRNLLAQMDAIAAAEAAEDAAYEALQDEIWEALQQAQWEEYMLQQAAAQAQVAAANAAAAAANLLAEMQAALDIVPVLVAAEGG